MNTLGIVLVSVALGIVVGGVGAGVWFRAYCVGFREGCVEGMLKIIKEEFGVSDENEDNPKT